MRRCLSLAGLLALWSASWATAQPVSAQRDAGRVYLSLGEVALRLGYSTTRAGNSLTVRTPEGVLVVFAGSPDILYRRSGSAETLERSEQNLSAPVRLSGEAWYAPEDLFRLLGGEVSATDLKLAERSFPLRFRQSAAVQAGARAALSQIGQAPALSFYAPGEAGDETVSVLILDLGLLSLALPEQQRDLDNLMTKFRDEKPLYFVLTSLADTAWSAEFTVTQSGRSEPLRAPFGVRVLEGSAERVAPDAPVSGLLLLPGWVNVRRELELSWSGASAAVQFRY